VFEGASVDEVALSLHKVGVPHQDVSRVIATLHEHRVLRTTDGTGFSNAVPFVATRLAAFLINDLACRFNYAEMCTLDAHIYDDITWNRMVELTSAIQAERDSLNSLSARISRVRAFLDYLLGIEEHWAVECRRRNLPAPWDVQVLRQNILPALEQDISRAQRSADTMKVRRQGFGRK